MITNVLLPTSGCALVAGTNVHVRMLKLRAHSLNACPRRLFFGCVFKFHKRLKQPRTPLPRCAPVPLPPSISLSQADPAAAYRIMGYCPQFRCVRSCGFECTCAVACARFVVIALCLYFCDNSNVAPTTPHAARCGTM